MKQQDIKERIERLKSECHAVVLAHNYQVGEVQDVADFVGDSLELSQKAAKLDADVIVFCGVHFMAETAAILAPEKTILMPDIHAGCPMADMITAEELKDWKKQYPGRKVVCYVNTSAEVKAECDICCTSSNALQVVEYEEGDEILFAPDKNLAAYVARFTKKKIIPWDGYCYVHHNITARDVREKKERFPEAEVWVHPECRPEVIDLADKVLSTGKMIKEARVTPKAEILIGTETGIIYRMKKENPGRVFHPIKDFAFCSNMKKINLDKVLKSLEGMKHKVEVPLEISQRARGSIEKMVRI
ncbi:MAG: quinolinate synthase NadA [Candidatus Aminicenantes bacterium]|nr:quinolinate synthase NadA [Candidatus Aminicenantes bacterium]MDH5385513.1 quinolinate synthase NadA [Candidatus Aminicenantes bacterium]MDH5744174.1 quinolinate synthase NadA [Candidatus Aminicenantes bacterium]